MSHRQYHVIVAVLMLLVLLGSTVLAWWISKKRSAGILRGAELLAELRSKTVSAIWKPQPAKWYLLVANNKPVGWRVKFIAQKEDVFEGMDVVARYENNRPAGGQWERWTLNNDAAESRYVAGSFNLAAPRTQIELSGGWVKTIQPVHVRPGAIMLKESIAAAPENYMPEGSAEALFVLLAEKKTSADFKTIVNDIPPEGGRPVFIPLTAEYLPPDDKMPQAFAKIGLKYSEAKDTSLSFYIDAGGNPLLILHDGLEEQSVSPEQVIEHYEDAQKVVENLQKLIGWQAS